VAAALGAPRQLRLAEPFGVAVALVPFGPALGSGGCDRSRGRFPGGSFGRPRFRWRRPALGTRLLSGGRDRGDDRGGEISSREIEPAERRSPEYLAKFLPQEIERWAKPILAAHISAD
jgi:hypothetical protein